MNRLTTTVLCAFVALMASLGFTAQAQAGYDDFGLNYGMEMGPDFGSGNIWGSGSAQNAVAMGMSSNAYIHYHENEGAFVCHGNTSIWGVWGNPGDDNPLYSVLENGLYLQSSLSWETVYENGQGWEFEQSVGITMFTNIGLSFGNNDGETEMYGYFSANSYGVGMIPTNVWASATIYEPGHPAGLPDWQASINWTYQVTSGFHLVPAPGAFALLGLGGISFRLRRRS